MVRLESLRFNSAEISLFTFQFLNGAIRILGSDFDLGLLVPFQFLNGAIRINLFNTDIENDDAFQFLNGAIRMSGSDATGGTAS